MLEKSSCMYCDSCDRMFYLNEAHDSAACATKRIALRDKWNEFVVKYHVLLTEYDVEFDWGCGCCSGYHTIGGERAEGEGFERA